MAEISKLSGVAIADVAKVDAVTKANIANINDLTIPSAAAFLLDTYTGAAGAWSVRKLSSTYTGDCIRVRENATDNQTDIGFDSNGLLDTAAIVSFATTYSATDVYVTTVYDQSGNSNNLTIATVSRQPGIYVNSAIVQENGLPAFDYADRTTNGSRSQSNIRGATDNLSVYMVSNLGTSNFRWYWGVSGSSSNSEGLLTLATSTTIAGFMAGTTASGTTADLYQQRLVSYTRDGRTLNSINLRVDASDITLAGDDTVRTLVAGDMRIGERPYGGSQMTGNWQECVVWASDQSTNTTGIETNLNNYFSIY